MCVCVCVCVCVCTYQETDLQTKTDNSRKTVITMVKWKNTNVSFVKKKIILFVF